MGSDQIIGSERDMQEKLMKYTLTRGEPENRVTCAMHLPLRFARLMVAECEYKETRGDYGGDDTAARCHLFAVRSRLSDKRFLLEDRRVAVHEMSKRPQIFLIKESDRDFGLARRH